jgi:hypothetical protein
MTECEDDRSIVNSDHLYRRIPPTQAPYNHNKQRRWPSSAALLPSSGDTEVSVYLGSLLEEFGLEPAAVLEGHEDYGLITFPVGAARAAGYGVKRDPILNATRPLSADPAHGVLTGTPTTGKQTRRRLARVLLDDPRVAVLRDPVGGIEAAEVPERSTGGIG